MTGNDPVEGEVQILPSAAFIDVWRPQMVNVAQLKLPESPAAVTPATPVEPFVPETEFDHWLLAEASRQWGYLFGTTTYYPGSSGWWPYFRAYDAVLFNNSDLRASGTFNLLGGVSQTNVQVAGVDEADLVETDGKYLYIISGQSLVIIETDGDEKLEVVSRVALDMKPVGMYLSDDRIALISTTHEYGDFWWSNGSQKTVVTVLDVADRAAPKLVQKTEMDGQLVASRVVDGQLRLVLNNSLNLPMPIARLVEGEAALEPPPAAEHELLRWRHVPVITMATDDLVAIDYVGGYTIDETYVDPVRPQYVYETLDEYLTRISDTFFESIQLNVRSLSVDGSVLAESSLLDTADVEEWGSAAGNNLTTVATFDMHSDDAGPAAKATVRNNGATQVYMTAGSVYVFGQEDAVWQPGNSLGIIGRWQRDLNIWKFAIDGESNKVKLVAKGKTDGTLLNQFAADEQDGYLRIVTAPSDWQGTGHSVVVLEQVGKNLKVVGSLEGIAKNEVLYSVRFDGDRAYFVTFRQTDPLFVVDLSDPTSPTMMGELHIPGYSDYLQPIDENHLLAIGRGANESNGMFEELQVSIFNVSDPTDPQLVHRYSFGGGRSTATPATGDRWQRGDGDHHAVSYFADEGIFTLPIFTAESWSWGPSVSESLFEFGEGGLQVFRIDVATGFESLGIIEHDELVERSVRIGDRLLAISGGRVSMHELTNPANELAAVDFGSESNVEFVELVMFRPPPTVTPEIGIAMAGTGFIDDVVFVEHSLESLATGPPTTPVVDLRAGWALPSLERSRLAQPARVVVWVGEGAAPRVDVELLRLLATPYSAQNSSRAFDASDTLNADDDGSDAGEVVAAVLARDAVLESFGTEHV